MNTKKRNIPRVFFQSLVNIDSSFIQKDKKLSNLLLREVPVAIEQALKTNKESATLFEINTTGLYVNVPKTSWVSALETCVAEKVKKEEFEECIKLSDLINKVKNKVTDGRKRGKIIRDKVSNRSAS